RPDRTLAVVTIGGDRLNIAGADIEDANLVELVVGGFDEGKPVAVGGPGEIAELAVHGLRNASIRPGLEVVEPELLVPIGMGEPLTIGRRDPVGPQDVIVSGELGRPADAIARKVPEFGLAGRGGQRENGLAIGEEAGIAVTDTGLVGDLNDAAGFGRHGEEGATSCKHGAGAVRRQVDAGEIVERLLDPVDAHLVEVGLESDGDEMLLAAADVEDPEVAGAGVNDAAIVERGRLDVKDVLVTELLHVLAVRRHGVEITDAIAVGNEVNAAIPEHRIGGGSWIVGGKRNSFLGRVEAPDALGGAALVALGVARLRVPACEEERVAGSVVDGFGGLGERDELPIAAIVNENDLIIGQRGVAGR